VDRTRFGAYFGSGEGIQDFHNLLSLIGQNYDRQSRTVNIPAFVRGGLARFHAGRESEQELQHHLGPRRRRVRPRRPELQLPDRVPPPAVRPSARPPR